MSLKIWFLAFTCVPIIAGSAVAADQLADTQFNYVTAGGVNPLVMPSAPDVVLPTATCDGCTVVTETDVGTTLVYSGGFAGLLHAYNQGLQDKGYTKQ